MTFKNMLYGLMLVSLFYSCGSEPYEISRENVERIITELASDEMRGRQAFSEDINKAADVIAREFTEIGLNQIAGEDNYFQEFQVYSLSPNNSRLTIDNREIQTSEYFLTADRENISIDNVDAIRRIGVEDDFREKFGEYSGSGKDLVILVDTAHQQMFARYQSFFGRSRRLTELGNSGSQVFSLYVGGEPGNIQLKAEYDLEEQPLKNVAGMIPGKRQNEFVLFSAHYDHIGIRQPVEGDSIANGANDDASGTTAVIELARYFKSRSVPERTLLFVAFTAEESGGYGSSYFSKQLNPDEIIAMFNIEMIGKPAVEGPNSAWITGFDKSNFGELLQESAEGSIYSFNPDPYPSQNLFYRSDNATLARLGVPAHSISTTPIDVDKDYHQVSDEVSTLDLEHLTNTVKAIAVGAEGMVNGTLTPTRVDTAEID